MAAEPGAVVPPAVAHSPDEIEKGTWPPPEEQLEKWMMNTVKEGDTGARFLRTMLQMNPAYGTYLQTDTDLVNVVHMFSKRIKTKISQFDSPSNVPPQILTQPLCEMVWRVVGFVMHGVIELEEEANMPVPKEASGMIRMLLHTNSQLSAKLNDLRRVYLKELSAHRDSQRNVSKIATRAIANLHDQPIMFFEPLEFVLDETTKDFVREAVVERMKLEMRTSAMNSDENAEMTKYIEEIEKELDDLKNELKTLRANNNRLEEQMKTMGVREEKTREDLKFHRTANEEKGKQIVEMEETIKKLTGDIGQKDKKIAFLEGKLAEGSSAAAEVKTEVQYADNSEEMEELSQKLINLETENAKMAAELAKLRAENDEFRNNPNVVQGEEKVVYKDDPEMKRLLEQALQVEKELRRANEALERALNDLETEAAALREELGKKAVAPKKVQKVAESSTKRGVSDEEAEELTRHAVDKALKKARKEWDDEKAALQKQIDKLTKQLAEQTARADELQESLDGEPKEKKQKVVKQIGVPEEEHTKLKIKLHETEELYENLQDEYAKLEQKVQMLMAKLKEKFSDDEMGEILDTIKLAPPPIRKKRKKKAYQRLYDDAQRRILEMKMKQEKLKALEERNLRKMAKVVANARDKRKVEMLGHLHKANQQTSRRFHDALGNLIMSQAGEDGEEYESGEEGGSMRRIDRLTDLEELTMSCFKDGVCPRCAFSALSTYSAAAQQRQKSPSQSPSQPGASTVMSGSFGMSGSSALTYSGPGASFGTPWMADQPGGGFTTQSLVPARFGISVPGGRPPNRHESPPPWDMAAIGLGHRSGSGSASRSPERRLGSPLGAGPTPGSMPFDNAFPMPAPPWRQSQPDVMAATPWQNQSSGASPSFASSGPPVGRAGTGAGEVGSGAFSMDSSGSLFASSAPGGNTNAVPPWRRARSNSPTRKGNSRSPSPAIPQARELPGPVAQPPSGSPPLQNRGIMPSPGGAYGRLGRQPGSDRTPPPVPGRVPAAQTIALDPIVRPNVSFNEKDPSPSMRAGSGPNSSRSPSPPRVGHTVSDGFSKMRVAHDPQGQFESEMGRAQSAPFGKQPTRGSDGSGSGPPGPTHGAPSGSLGGGGSGTHYTNQPSRQLPSVPSHGTRSTPSLPVAVNPLRAPWQSQEVPWESSAPAKRLTPKEKKKPGPGFLLTAVASQERLSQGHLGGLPPGGFPQ